jgi:hypothetical protein
MARGGEALAGFCDILFRLKPPLLVGSPAWQQALDLGKKGLDKSLVLGIMEYVPEGSWLSEV